MSKKIDRALREAYVSGSFGMPTAVPNEHYTPTSGTAYAEISVIRNQAVPISVGAGGQDETIGIFQITLRYPPDKGDNDANTKADEMLAFFHIGRVFTFDGQRVQITAKDRGTGRNEGGWYQLICRFTFQARTARTSA